MDQAKIDAEREVRQIVKQIGAIRDSDRTEAEKTEMVTRLQDRALELRKITGPVKITGAGGVVMPSSIAKGS
jgi:hypothetical protein